MSIDKTNTINLNTVFQELVSKSFFVGWLLCLFVLFLDVSCWHCMCLQTLFVFRTTLNTSFITAIPFSLRYQPQMQIVYNLYGTRRGIKSNTKGRIGGFCLHVQKNDSIFTMTRPDADAARWVCTGTEWPLGRNSMCLLRINYRPSRVCVVHGNDLPTYVGGIVLLTPWTWSLKSERKYSTYMHIYNDLTITLQIFQERE